jgi:hypothetical protein
MRWDPPCGSEKEAETMESHLETATEIDDDGSAIVKLNGQ